MGMFGKYEMVIMMQMLRIDKELKITVKICKDFLRWIVLLNLEQLHTPHTKRNTFQFYI